MAALRRPSAAAISSGSSLAFCFARSRSAPRMRARRGAVWRFSFAKYSSGIAWNDTRANGCRRGSARGTPGPRADRCQPWSVPARTRALGPVSVRTRALAWALARTLASARLRASAPSRSSTLCRPLRSRSTRATRPGPPHPDHSRPSATSGLEPNRCGPGAARRSRGPPQRDWLHHSGRLPRRPWTRLLCAGPYEVVA
jgi:hypothetical protein